MKDLLVIKLFKMFRRFIRITILLAASGSLYTLMMKYQDDSTVKGDNNKNSHKYGIEISINSTITKKATNTM